MSRVFPSLSGVSQNSDEGGRTDDIVAEKLGFGSRDTYRKEKYIVDNANSTLLSDWDKINKINLSHSNHLQISIYSVGAI